MYYALFNDCTKRYAVFCTKSIGKSKKNPNIVWFDKIQRNKSPCASGTFYCDRAYRTARKGCTSRHHGRLIKPPQAPWTSRKHGSEGFKGGHQWASLYADRRNCGEQKIYSGITLTLRVQKYLRNPLTGKGKKMSKERGRPTFRPIHFGPTCFHLIHFVQS